MCVCVIVEEMAEELFLFPGQMMLRRSPTGLLLPATEVSLAWGPQWPFLCSLYGPEHGIPGGKAEGQEAQGRNDTRQPQLLLPPSSR